MDEKPTKLGDYLREHGETQEDFAARAGVPAPMVSMWSRATTRVPGRANANKIEIATTHGGVAEVPATYWDEVAAAIAAQKTAEQKRSRRRSARAAHSST